MALTISSDAPYPGLVTITLVGELDLSGADALQDTVTEAVKTPEVDGLLLDLAGLTFLASTGTSVLVAGWRMAGESGKRLRVDGARGMVREVLRITGVWSALTGEPTDD